jgi:hypothetical protein
MLIFPLFNALSICLADLTRPYNYDIIARWIFLTILYSNVKEHCILHIYCDYGFCIILTINSYNIPNQH